MLTYAKQPIYYKAEAMGMYFAGVTIHDERMLAGWWIIRAKDCGNYL